MHSARIRSVTSVFAGLLCLLPPSTPAQTTPIPAPRAIAKTITPITNPVIQPFNNPVTPNFPTLVFDAETKEYDPKPSELIAPFTFQLTNVWTNEIVIMQVKASCGCTTAKLPPTPWHIPPGGTGEVGAQVNLAGKPPGMAVKTLTFFTSVGNRILTLKVKIPPMETGSVTMTPEARKAAMAQAAVDPKTIFRGECASCHVDRGANAFGQDLYAVDCGICHESSHRDGGVPDLHALKHSTDLDYWKTIISLGKPHTMMPGFAATEGGPLNPAQVASLAEYLNRTISHHFSSPPAKSATAQSPSSNRHF